MNLKILLTVAPIDIKQAAAVSFTVILKGSITTVLTRIVDVHEGLSDAGLPALGDVATDAAVRRRQSDGLLLLGAHLRILSDEVAEIGQAQLEAVVTLRSRITQMTLDRQELRQRQLLVVLATLFRDEECDGLGVQAPVVSLDGLVQRLNNVEITQNFVLVTFPNI